MRGILTMFTDHILTIIQVEKTKITNLLIKTKSTICAEEFYLKIQRFVSYQSLSAMPQCYNVMFV